MTIVQKLYENIIQVRTHILLQKSLTKKISSAFFSRHVCPHETKLINHEISCNKKELDVNEENQFHISL